MIDPYQYILSKFPGKTPNSKGKIHTYCPFHDDKHPSFSIDLDRDGLFVCGSRRCGVRGNFALFYKMMEGIDNWKEVFESLNMPQVSKKMMEIGGKKEVVVAEKEQVDEFPYYPFVEPLGSVESIPYLKDRGLSNEVCELFGVLYGRDGEFSEIDIRNSLVVPIFDLDGAYKTFQVRHLGATKKLRWDFPVGSPVKNYLYAGWLVSRGDGYLWIVEGVSDAWNLSQSGIQSVGLFSSRASNVQLNKIYELCKSYELTPVVCLDGDVSSVDPIEKDLGQLLQKELIAYGLECKIIHLERDEDPGSLARDRIDLLKRQHYEEVLNDG